MKHVDVATTVLSVCAASFRATETTLPLDPPRPLPVASHHCDLRDVVTTLRQLGWRFAKVSRRASSRPFVLIYSFREPVKLLSRTIVERQRFDGIHSCNLKSLDDDSGWCACPETMGRRLDGHVRIQMHTQVHSGALLLLLLRESEHNIYTDRTCGDARNIMHVVRPRLHV